jgi:hypothetical protein
MGRLTIRAPDDVSDLWNRTVVAASHDCTRVSAADLLLRMLRRERGYLSRKRGAGWLERIEAEYHRPKPGRTTTAPPPTPDSFVD